MSKILDLLRPGDRRTVGEAAKAVALTLRDRRLCEQLVAGLFEAEPGLRMRCADVLEKVSLQHPAWLQPYKDALLYRAAEIDQPEVRWHLAQMLPRLKLTSAERSHAMAVLRGFLDCPSSIVKTCAIEALAEFASHDPAQRAECAALIERLSHTGTPAMRARGRNLLARFARM